MSCESIDRKRRLFFFALVALELIVPLPTEAQFSLFLLNAFSLLSIPCYLTVLQLFREAEVIPDNKVSAY